MCLEVETGGVRSNTINNRNTGLAIPGSSVVKAI